MSKHSSKYLERKADLILKESEARRALDLQGVKTQKSLISLTKVFGAGLLALVGFYAIYRLLGLRNSEPEELESDTEPKLAKVVTNPLIDKLVKTGTDVLVSRVLKSFSKDS